MLEQRQEQKDSQSASEELPVALPPPSLERRVQTDSPGLLHPAPRFASQSERPARTGLLVLPAALLLLLLLHYLASTPRAQTGTKRRRSCRWRTEQTGW